MIFSFTSLLAYGQLGERGLQIDKSFSAAYTADSGTDCMLLRALSLYAGESAPKLHICLTAAGQNEPFYQSHDYTIGKKNEYTLQSWRIPPLFLPGITVSVHISIPEGTVLYIKDFGTFPDKGTAGRHTGLRHNAHLGFWGLAPDNTMPAFELAAASGFSSCIVVPKVTRDGVLVCIHDDTINRTARDAEGCAPAEKIYVWDKTYDELSAWEYGSYKNELYKGARLPLLSDFFDLCAKTGMSPMFSTHPGLTVPQWEQVRGMLKRRGLLKKFHIKSFDIKILQCAYSIFGEEIDGYTFDVSAWSPSCIDAMRSLGIDTHACRAGIEFPFSQYTEAIAKSITEAGFFASAWGVWRHDFADYEQLIGWGVTEFTEDYHCSMGLNY